MITEQDLRDIDILVCLAEKLQPAIKAQLNCVCWNSGYGFVENNDYCGTRIKADLRLIRRLALNISKNL